MSRMLGFTLIAFGLLGSEPAAAESQQHLGLKTTDEAGCYITDGSFIRPTIGVAAALYHEAWFPKERALRIIQVALASGCDIEEPDDVGSTPLVASIIYNEPELAKFLLENGANPYLPISSSKLYLNGQNAFQVLQFFTSRHLSHDRSQLVALFGSYRTKE